MNKYINIKALHLKVMINHYAYIVKNITIV